jgi:acyl transferase domain-containing protein
MACHFPGAKNIGEYWNNLKNGVSSIREIPNNRWDKNKFYSSEYETGNLTIIPPEGA